MFSRQARPSARRLLPPVALTGVLSLTAVGLGITPAGAVEHDDGTVTLEVLGITDFHGALETAPYLDAQIDEIAAANPDTVFVSAGDNIGGSAYASAIQRDNPTIEVLNAMGLEASAVGNHEFDAGYADLAARIEGTDEGLVQTAFPYLGANVEGEEPDLPPYEVWESPSGVTIGFIGTVTTETPDIVAQEGIEGISFTDEAAATNEYAAQLTDGNDENGEADAVVALAHVGATEGFVGALSDDIDVLFTGHTHQEYLDDQDDLLVIQGGASGAYLSHVTLTYDTGTGEVTAASGENIPITVPEDTEAAPGSSDIRAIVDEALAEAEVLGQEPVGSVQGPVNRGSNTGEPDGSNRGVESPLGNLLGEVAKYTAESVGLEPDFGTINPGGIRADLDPNGDGTVTYAEAFDVQPFGNTIGTIALTGAQVVTMLEQQFQPNSDRPMLRLGLSTDLEYTYDPEAAQGEHISTVSVDGEPIDLEAVYTVASNTFLLGGQDGFTVFAEGTNFVETGVVDLQGLVNYLEQNPGLAADHSQRSVGVTPSGQVVPGEDITLDISSLTFTTTEPAPEEVSVSHDGELLATTTDIDTTITPDTDETGKASLTFTVPASSETGALPVVLSTDLGTEVLHLLDVVAPRPEPSPEPEPEPSPEPEPEPEPGLRHGFFLNDDWDGIAEHEFMFGRFGDEVLIGDFDGDGQDSITVRRGNTFYVSNAPKGGPADAVFVYGRPGDTVLVGDWDGNGVDTLAVRRGNVYHVKNSLAGGPADVELVYGRPGDQVVVGDWDGNETDTFAVRRGAQYFVKNAIAGGRADAVVVYGRPGDVTLAGDWDGDGTDTFAVRRGAEYFVKNAIAGGPADIELVYGRAGDEVYVGDWNGDGTDTLGVRRLP